MCEDTAINRKNQYGVSNNRNRKDESDNESKKEGDDSDNISYKLKMLCNGVSQQPESHIGIRFR